MRPCAHRTVIPFGIDLSTRLSGRGCAHQTLEWGLRSRGGELVMKKRGGGFSLVHIHSLVKEDSCCLSPPDGCLFPRIFVWLLRVGDSRSLSRATP